MSNTNDSFIEEVTEEVRRDKLFGLMRRYGWIAIVAVLALVGGTAFKQWQDAQAETTARALGESLYAALEIEDAGERADALAALDVSGEAAAPKLILEAAALAEIDKKEDAAVLLERVGSMQDVPRIWRDLAELKRVIILGRLIDPEERLRLLSPLMTPGAPYRVLAREQEALARYDLGEKDQAIAIFGEILEDQDASPILRLRAAQLKLVLEGTQDET